MRTFFFSLLFLAATLEAQPPAPATATVVLQWDAVTDPRVTEVRIYYGGRTHLYDGFFPVPASQTQATLDGLEEGEQYYFAAAAHSDEMGDGQLSREVRFKTPRGPEPNTTIHIDTSTE